jgi:hypothetical protein
MVLERKMGTAHGQVNARIMSTCVSKDARRMWLQMTNHVHVRLVLRTCHVDVTNVA